MSTPIETIRDYVECYNNSEKPNESMSFLLDAALCSTEADEWSHKQRCEMIFFGRQTQKALVALFAISSPILHLFDTSNQKQ